MNEGETIYLSCGLNEKDNKVTKDDTFEYQSLSSKQEEAIAYNTTHNSGFKPWCSQDIVSSPDTDVIVLLLHQRPYICRNELFFFIDKLEHTLT